MKYVTTSYSGPDLDGYSCTVAYAELLRVQGKDAIASLWGDVHLEVEWVLKEFGLVRPSLVDMEENDRIVLLDASSPDDLPGGIRPEQVIEVIDHRKIHRASEFVHATIQIELVGAAATLVAERFQKAGIMPSKESALLLYGGILSNTQNFSAIDTPRDREMAAWLKGISEAPHDLAERMFTAKSDLKGDRLRQSIQNDTKILQLHGKIVGIAQLEVFEVSSLIDARRNEMESILDEVRREHDCDVTFLNMKDLATGQSTIVCRDDETSVLLHGLPDVEWNGRVGLSKTLTLRKQLSAWIDEQVTGTETR